METGKKHLTAVLLAVILLSIAFLQPVPAVAKNNQGKSMWNFNDEECGVALDVHGNLQLVDQTLRSGEYLYWNSSTISKGLKVKTESDCTEGYKLSVYASAVKGPEAGPEDSEILADFSLKVADFTSEAGDYNDVLEDWSDSVPDDSESPLKLGKVNESDTDGNIGTVDGTSWTMNYRYLMEPDDATSGEYFVELTYLVAAE